MASPAFVRLGPKSAAVSKSLDAADPGASPDPVELSCAQVPNEFDVGSDVLIWLGSDNNKGQTTAWTQGIRAIARCAVKEKAPLDPGQFRIVLEDVFIFPRTVAKEDLLRSAPDTYSNSLTNAAIIGINNYASQVVQLLAPTEMAVIGAMMARMVPEIRGELESRIPAMTKVQLSEPASESSSVKQKEPEAIVSPDIPEDDPILEVVRKLLLEDEVGGVLLVGPPGTGKSWYAKQIALSLTSGREGHIREVQFHPSYQYEDFVEGFVPDKDAGGFKLVDKHLLQMIASAQSHTAPVVMIIDEFSRTDPARVLGEAMTYMEGSLRGRDFFLPSGRITNIPKNLLFLATINPEDRSVDEIDAAMERRWAKVSIPPSPDKVKDFLAGNGMQPAAYGPVVEFFIAVQQYFELGHAYFRTVRDLESLKRLWDSQLAFLIQKRFRFEADTKDAIDALWATCIESISSAVPAVDKSEVQPAAT